MCNHYSCRGGLYISVSMRIAFIEATCAEPAQSMMFAEEGEAVDNSEREIDDM